MKSRKQNSKDLFEKSAAFFSKGEIHYEKTEGQVWDELNSKINSKPKKQVKNPVFSYEKYNIAALFLILVGFAAVTIFYSKTIESLPGNQITVEFMCGSKAELNAGSSLKYYPLRWKMGRKVFLSGEAFFEVEKGSTFQVASKNGKTEVLGTSFNVYARNDKYSVTCFTGKVKVYSPEKESVTLTPNTKAELENGVLTLNKNVIAEEAIGWKNKQFFFTDTPLKEVFDEIERQYAITVKIQPELANLRFSSNFKKTANVESVLENICTPMQITFVKQSDNVFLVKENQ